MWPFRRRDVEEHRSIDTVPWGSEWLPTTRPPSMHRALSMVPVYACTRLLADTISTLPIDLYRKTGDVRRPLSTPSLISSPTAHGTRVDWMHRCVVSLALRGNAFGFITSRDAMGWPTSVEWLNPDDVEVTDSLASGPGSYLQPLWYVGGRLVPAEDILHIPWYTLPWKVLGLSPIAAYATTINAGLSAQQYSADWFEQGGVPPGTFKNTSRTISKEDADLITARVTARIKTRKPLVYGSDWEYSPIAVSPNEAKFVDTMRLSATQVASIYGVDPSMVGGEVGGTMTYASVESLGLKQLVYCFGPWLARIEAALSNCFPRPQFVKFNVDALLRPDSATRWGVYKTAIETGVMTVDEIRALEDLPPRPPSAAPAPLPSPPPSASPQAAAVGASNGQPAGNGQQPAANGQASMPVRYLLPPDPWADAATTGSWTHPQ